MADDDEEIDLIEALIGLATRDTRVLTDAAHEIQRLRAALYAGIRLAMSVSPAIKANDTKQLQTPQAQQMLLTFKRAIRGEDVAAAVRDGRPGKAGPPDE